MRLSELQAKPAELDDLRSEIAARDDATKKYKPGVGAGDDMHWTVNSFMDKYGFKSIGAGAKGTVYAKKGYPYVLKVFGDDTAYLDWLHFCRAHQDNPYVPQIKGKPIHIGDGFYAVRLERLIKHPNAYGISNAIAALADRYEPIYEQGLPLDEVFNSNGRYNPISYIEEFAPDYLDNPQLQQVLKGMHELKEKGHRLDIHNDNIMSRGVSGNPVIIDALRER